MELSLPVFDIRNILISLMKMEPEMKRHAANLDGLISQFNKDIDFRVRSLKTRGMLTKDINKDPKIKKLLDIIKVVSDARQYYHKTIFTDSMVKGVGNYRAYQDFLSRPRSDGVHGMIDGNDFGRINKKWGQSMGDEAIRQMGGALSKAVRKHNGKLFRVGGDEFRFYFDNPEDAMMAVRTMHDNIAGLSPINGEHQHSVSIGLAHTPDESETALIQAKNVSKEDGHIPGQGKSRVHSLVRGMEGPVSMDGGLGTGANWAHKEEDINKPKIKKMPIYQSPVANPKPKTK